MIINIHYAPWGLLTGDVMPITEEIITGVAHTYLND